MTNELKNNAMTNEVAEEQLEGVAGGNWRESDGDYASGDFPRYHIGEIVWVTRGDHFVDTKCKILEVSDSKYGFWNREFVYKVQINKYGTLQEEWVEGGPVKEDVYESQLSNVDPWLR